MRNRFNDLEIENYRAFEKLSLTGLADVNLIVGRNNVGKTAIFEALALLGEPCLIDDSVVMNELRGLKKYAGDTLETWGLHFHDRNVDQPVRIRGLDADDETRILELQLGSVSDLLQAADRETEDFKRYGALLQQKAVRFDYRGPGEERGWAVSAVVGGELRVLGTSPLPTPYISAYPSVPRALANVPALYSGLVVGGQEEAVLGAVRSVFPEVTRLVQLSRAGEPTLFASVEDGSLLPVQLLGDGAARVIGWIVALLSAQNSLFVIDEIDSGLHHSVMESVFQSLFTLAKEREVQVFATTHSYEALEAINRARRSILIGGPSVKVIRLDRVEGRIVPVDYDAELFDTAIGMHAEVR